jgi:hypothetical protein
MQDHFTYADLAGRRRLRRYVIAAVLILGFILVLFGWAGWRRARGRTREVPPETANHDQFAGLVAAPENIPIFSTPEAVGCPTHPESWDLREVYPGDNYKRIEPNCVYEGLSRAVAWHLLERSGYTKLEAAEQLGLPEIPWEPAQSITGLTNTKGPMVIPLEMEWASHPSFRTWVVDAEGHPALAYSLRGCYRTRVIVGNRTESWGRYPVICVLAYDRDPGWTVTELGELHFSVDLTAELPPRRFALFGYAGERWVLLGELRDRQVTMEESSPAFQERAQVTERYGTVPWDTAWLEATFGLTMHPLPDAWQRFDADPAVIQAIATRMDEAFQEFGEIP